LSGARAVSPRLALRAAAALALLTIVLAASATAHAVLVKSAPASRQLLSRAPDRVQLWFNERLEPAFSTMSVWDAAGARVDTGDVAVGADDAKGLSVSLKPLAAGAYTVRFRVLSVDGHIVESSFAFSVKGP
jgi:copper resistance protein C